MSLRLRLTLWYTAILTAALLLVSVAVYFTLSFTLNQQTNQFLSARAQQYALALRPGPNSPFAGPGGPNREGFVRQLIATAITASNPDTIAQLVAPDGTPISHTTNLPAGWPADKGIIDTALRDGKTVSQTVRIGDTVFRIDNFPLSTPDGQPVGVLQLGRDITQQQSSLSGLREVLIFADLTGVIVAFGAGWLIARQALRPISRVAETAQDIGDSRDFARRVEYSGPKDELGRMCHAFNDMLGHIQSAYQQIENALQAQRRFVADASHELRTPLTTIRGNIGLLSAEAEMPSEDRREALQDMASEAERMSRLVANLLVLARADAGLHISKQPVNVDEIMQEVYRHARVLSDGVSLRLEGPQPAVVEGSPDYLKQLLLILVDNALKNTPPGGEVRMADPVENGTVRLMVSDTGKGIPAEALPHIFERFYQADKSRTGGGTGLGLAIAKWIAEEHGGRIEAQSQVGAGSTFTVVLPRNGHEPEPTDSGTSVAIG
ncbi:MAG TPA: HAMP domain-containing sensor histidine kinase [Chloroflexota bacterium]|nr:HAMP domain-containing sensor histidine kinase [Chloroflexota bacterium]